MESTLDFVEKVFTAQQKDYVLDSENGSSPAHGTEQLPARFHVSERRTRESVGTNAPETMFTSSDLRGDSETPALARDQSVQVETEVEPRYGGYVRIPFAGNRAGKPKRKEDIAQAAMAAVGIPTSQMMTTGDTAVTKSQTRDTAEGARD